MDAFQRKIFHGGIFMRKKSHISLARYLVQNLDDRNLKKHKLAFYLGSILPDCKPSFVYKKHEITGTFEDVKREIRKLSSDYEKKYKRQKSKYYRNLGQVTHYLADYFTFPHNKIYPGNLKDHCVYEEELKRKLRNYLKSPEVKKDKKLVVDLKTPEALIEFIQKSHDDYLRRKNCVEDDIHSIVALNHQAVESITEFFYQAKEKHRLKHS